MLDALERKGDSVRKNGDDHGTKTFMIDSNNFGLIFCKIVLIKLKSPHSFSDHTFSHLFKTVRFFMQFDMTQLVCYFNY
jgi:hypothetical protein